MKYVTPIICAVVSATLVFVLMLQNINSKTESFQEEKLKFAEQMLNKRLEEYKVQIEKQLDGFSEAVSSNRTFTLRLLVEKDNSSTDITELASRYLAPMGFSVLDIADGQNKILSSGHFPASAGNPLAANVEKLSSEAIFIEEFVMGSEKLMLKAKKKFKIADIPFVAVGGVEVNSDFLRKLVPCDGFRVLLKHKNDYLGMDDIRSVSEIKDNKIIINDKEYLAVQIEISCVGEKEPPKLIVILEN